jgi:hypothetical protein
MASMECFAKLKLLLLRVAFLFLFIIVSQHLFSQQTTGSLKGVVIDSLERASIDSCKVTIAGAKTSKQLYTNRLGIFSSKELPLNDTLLLTYKAKGFQPFQSKIFLTTAVSSLDTVLLVPTAEVIEDIRIKSRVPAIALHHDTTEYAVDSFQHEHSTMIGDLLKDLPGIEIGEDGSISHNGKPITEITVNGEVFYSMDGAIALKNIPADIVGKIQVMDQKTKEQAFSDLASDGETKSLNIKLKPGFQQFGNLSAGGGTRNEANGNGMINGIDGAKQMSLTAGMNTMSRKSFEENNPALITASQNAGGHFSNLIGKGLHSNLNMNYGNNSNENETKSSLQQFIQTDSSFTTASNSSSKNKSNNYSANLNSYYTKNPKLLVNMTFSYAGGTNNSSSSNASSIIENGMVKTQTSQQSENQSTNNNMNLMLSVNKRFTKPGRTLSFNARSSSGYNHSDFLNHSNSSFYSGNQSREEILRQHIITQGNNRNVGFGFSYTEQLLKSLRLALSHNTDLAWAETDRKTFNIDTLTKQDQPDSAYSNKWSSNNLRSTSNASLVYTRQKFTINGGINAYIINSGRVMETKDNIEQRQQNFSPSLAAMYNISKTQNLRLSFSSTTQQPTIDQLQPIPDNTNPLFLRLGNPELKSSFTQNYSVNYNSVPATGKNIAGSVSYAPVLHSIVNASYYDADRKRISQFINVDGVYTTRANWNYSGVLKDENKQGTWSLNGNASYGKYVFFDNTDMLFTRNFIISQNLFFTRVITGNGLQRFNGNLSVNYQRTLSPSNSEGINSRSMYVVPRLEWSYTLKDRGEIRTSYDASFNSANYKVGSSENVTYADHTFMNDIRYQFTKRAGLHSNFSYRYNGRFPANENRNTYLLNFSAFTQVFKNGRGFLNFSANDVLNSNKDYSRMLGQNYIQEVQMAKQKSYYSVYFQYNWTKTKSNR